MFDGSFSLNLVKLFINILLEIQLEFDENQNDWQPLRLLIVVDGQFSATLKQILGRN